MRLTLILALFALVLSAQSQKEDTALVTGDAVPSGAVAVLDQIVIGEPEFIAEAMRRLNMPNNTDGRRLLDGLVQEALITAEATRRNIGVSDDDIAKKVAILDEALKGQGTSLDAEMAKSGVSRDIFVAKLRTTLALEQLAREDLKIPSAEVVTGAQQQAWIKNRVSQVTIVTDRTKLPEGVVATADGQSISARTLVRMASQTGSRREMVKAVETVMQHALVQTALKSRAITLTEADLEANVARKKAAFAANPQFAAIDFAEFIRQQTGADMDGYRHSLPFVIDAAIWRLGQNAFNETDVKKAYETDIDQFGPLRTVRHILIAASDSGRKGPDGKPLPSIDKASAQLVAIRKELEGGKTFESLARLYSEDKGTKLSGGKLPPFAPGASPFHAAFTQAAVGLKVGGTSDPVVTTDGVHLIHLEKIEPAPPMKDVEGTIREALARKLLQESWLKARRGWDIRLN